jgi:hypothetical protein
LTPFILVPKWLCKITTPGKEAHMSNKGKPITFRPSADARTWLDACQRAGFEMSEIINLCLESKQGGMTEVERVVRHYIEGRMAELGGLLPPKSTKGRGRPVTHGRYSKAAGSDGKNPVPDIALAPG